MSMRLRLACLLLLVAGISLCEEFPRVNAIVKAVRKSGSAVVNISTERVVKQVDPLFEFHQRFFQNPFRDPFNHYGTRVFKTTSQGSGVVIDPDGYIITNEHVVHGATRITVAIPEDSTEYEGRLIAGQAENDLALIKIDTERILSAVEMGDSDALMIGETAIALGNPFGLQNTVTTGVISATNRSVEYNGDVVFEKLLQTDAAINPGNSGGALLDINGRLIGINTAIRPDAEGIGFAIPVNRVREIMKMLLSLENLKGLWIGLEIDEHPEKGVQIVSVEPGSPAAEAGLKKGDIITAVNGKQVASCFAFQKKLVEIDDPEKTVTVTVNDIETKLTLKEIGKALLEARCGLQGIDLNRWIARRLRISRVDKGVLVTDVIKDSPAASIGLEPGDVIIQLAETPLKRVADMIAVLRKHPEPGKKSIVVIRNNGPMKGAIVLK